MLEKLKQRIANTDRFTWRGIIYASLAVIGLIFEIFILKQFRPFLLFGYGVIIFIGLICIIVLKEGPD